MKFFRRLSIILLTSMATCLFAANQIVGDDGLVRVNSVQGSQVQDSLVQVNSDFPILTRLQVEQFLPQRLSHNTHSEKLSMKTDSNVSFSSDYILPVTTEASKFSHIKQRIQLDPVVLVVNYRQQKASKVIVEVSVSQAVPWYMITQTRGHGRVSGWKESNLTYKSLIYLS